MEATNLFETWSPINGYEGFYAVSNHGRVKSIKRQTRANTNGVRIVKERILSAGISQSGYAQVVLCKDGKHKNFLIHRLVADAFVDNPNGYTVINHKNENKLDNSATNLEWCTQKYNVNYGAGIEKCRKQKYKKVCMFDKNHQLIKTFESGIDAEEQTGISRKQISMVCRKQHHTAGGYFWSFESEVAYGR